MPTRRHFFAHTAASAGAAALGNSAIQPSTATAEPLSIESIGKIGQIIQRANRHYYFDQFTDTIQFIANLKAGRKIPSEGIYSSVWATNNTPGNAPGMLKSNIEGIEYQSKKFIADLKEMRAILSAHNQSLTLKGDDRVTAFLREICGPILTPESIDAGLSRHTSVINSLVRNKDSLLQRTRDLDAGIFDVETYRLQRKAEEAELNISTPRKIRIADTADNEHSSHPKNKLNKAKAATLEHLSQFAERQKARREKGGRERS